MACNTFSLDIIQKLVARLNNSSDRKGNLSALILGDHNFVLQRSEKIIENNKLVGLKLECSETVGNAVNSVLYESRNLRISPHAILVEILKSIGLAEVVVIDLHRREGVDYVIDLGSDVDSQEFEVFREKHPDGFDLILDLGTIDYVTNFPSAVSKLSGLVNHGGYLLLTRDIVSHNRCPALQSPDFTSALFACNGWETVGQFLTIKG